MFNFLNSTALFAAAAALIPLIIHLFSKRRVKIVEFSSLKHLKAMQKRQVRRLKIRQLLLLILRMLIILAVVLAFARPTTKSGIVGSHASVSAVVLLDNSASMNRYVVDGNLFEIARQRVSDVLNSFGEVDQVLIIPLVGSDNMSGVSIPGSPAMALETLDRIQVTSGVANLERAMEQAIRILREAPSLNKELYLVADRQRVSLPGKSVSIDDDIRVCMVQLPLGEFDNNGVTSVDFGGQLLIPGHDFEITAYIRNYGSGNPVDLIASLFMDGNRVAQTDVSVVPGQETSVRFTRSVSYSGFHSGYIEISDDRFADDNRSYFSFHIPDQFSLLIIRGDEATPLISLALVPSESINQYWSVKEVDPDRLSGVNLAEYDAIFICGIPHIADSYRERLISYVNHGKALFLTYGAQTEIDRINTDWSGLTGVTFDQPVRQDFSRAGYYTIGYIDGNHPVFSVFDFDDSNLPELKFYTLPALHVSDDAQVVMRFSGDRPALIENNHGDGKVLTFTGPISPRYSDIASHAFFVPFISRIAEYLTTDMSALDLGLTAGTILPAVYLYEEL